MTCKQLHGPCDALIHGETADEMMQNSQKHGMEMAQAGDADHIRVMEDMGKHMNDLEAVKKFMEQFHADFAATPDDA